MTGTEMEEVMPSKFWEPTQRGISTRPADTGDAIKAFLGDHAKDILRHGCHCSAFHDHFHNAHDTFMDPVDFSCQKWRAARTCIHLKGGPCYGQKHVTYSIENGICLEDRDTCAGAACMVDLFHQRIINMEISYSMHNEDYQNTVWEKKQCTAQSTFDLENADEKDILMKSLTENGEGPTKNEVEIQKAKVVQFGKDGDENKVPYVRPPKEGYSYDKNDDGKNEDRPNDLHKLEKEPKPSFEKSESEHKLVKADVEPVQIITSPLRSGHMKKDNLFKMVTHMKIERESHQCCGIAPRFIKYKTSEKTCENGHVSAIGGELEVSDFFENGDQTIKNVNNDHISEEESNLTDLADFF